MSTDADNVKNVDGGEPQDVKAVAVARAHELLGAAPAAAPAGPKGFAKRLDQLKEESELRRRLEALGETDLARRLLERARDLAAGESPADAIKLAKRLEQLDDSDLARQLLNKVKAALINEARDVLRGTDRSPGDILALAKNLGSLDEFNFGWRVLDKAREQAEFGKFAKGIQIIQKRALFTYKDVTQPLGKRLDEALDYLENNAGIPESVNASTLAGATSDQETLGQAGSIYKRKWELDKQERHLRASRALYERGYAQRPWADQGYTSINYAFVLDLMADLDANEAEGLRATARKVRQEIVKDVPPMGQNSDGLPSWLVDEWFFYSTVGEAHFGLGEFDEAIEWLVEKPKARQVRPPDWEFETTARQLANLVRVQSEGDDFTPTPAWEAFKRFLAESPWGKGGDVSSEAVRQLPEGKVGLALSGGGFRSSLFHIGVLARLAELDMLRRVEVLSCVSGGSIVGAHYYLEVRKLLGEKPDAEIGKEDYVEIVNRVEREFLAGVQTNIRTNVLTDSRAVRRMLHRDYSRTTRLGELYEEEIYSRVADEVGAARGADGKVRERYMHELTIRPLLNDNGKDKNKVRKVWEDFKPRNHNWRREAKAPILILNAATLNTGHNWQFTSTYMGESPATIHAEVDSVYRLRRKYYTEAPDTQAAPQRVRLGTAVAASSCVPVLFEPVVLDDIYEARDGGGVGKKISVKLVDGGVCDNQGVAGLLEQDCTVLLVSDGSGHLGALDRPSSKSLSVGMRANGVLQARIRGTQYRELDARLSASMLNGLMFVHLKKGLDNPPVGWKGSPDELRPASLNDSHVLTKYRISKEVQRRLA
nr:patatin-like phospholipase family protein [Acidobacteriota bacterium]